ncbi:MAG: hypothetical protein AAF264_05830 [Pseudomonadota bacterium]
MQNASTQTSDRPERQGPVNDRSIRSTKASQSNSRTPARIVVVDAPIGLIAGAVLLALTAFIAAAGSHHTGIADAPIKIEPLPVADAK